MRESVRQMDWEDRITAMLCEKFGSYGYSRYRMEKLEPYDLYLENKNYLKSTSVITFPDATGRLMALKPDVTMSVVKNVRQNEVEKKVFYSENVFRMERDTGEYREVRQVGLEYIGGEGVYPAAETVLLAAESLQAIGEDFILCLSHMDFVLAMLEQESPDAATTEMILQSVRRRRPHSLEKAAVSQSLKRDLTAIMALPADAEQALKLLKEMAVPDTAEMLSELHMLVKVLTAAGYRERVRIDFSIMNDTDYYNGISFVGYCKGIPKAVLSGGRYDNLMRRFGKPQCGLGFAVYIGELLRSFAAAPDYDVDMILEYGDKSPVDALHCAQEYIAQGFTVRVCRETPKGLRARQIIRLEEQK